jgi:mRNA-degrading endonuclease toxin of MazEF toxin-antitoxin module
MPSLCECVFRQESADWRDDSDILVDQMLAWDNELFRRNLGPVPEAVRDEVRRALLEFLDLLY